MSRLYEDTQLCLLAVHEVSHAVVARAVGFTAEARVWRNPDLDPARVRWLGVCVGEGAGEPLRADSTRAIELQGGPSASGLRPLMLVGLAGVLGELIAAGLPECDLFALLDAKRSEPCWSDSDQALCDGFDRAHVEFAEWVLRRRWPLVIDEARTLYQHALMQAADQAALHAACQSAAVGARAEAAGGAGS